MGFPFNLFGIDWAAHADAFGRPGTAVAEWLAALADDQPAVREEAAAELWELFASQAEIAPVTPHAVEPLFKLLEAEAAKGRALAAITLAQVGLCARSRPSTSADAVLRSLEAERGSLETLASRHAASTPLGAAVRALLMVVTTPAPPAQLSEQLDAVEALVLEADAKDNAPPPDAAQLGDWLEQVKSGAGNALALAQRAATVDPGAALAILAADPKAGDDTSVLKVQRAVLKAKCETAALRLPTALRGPWSRTEQALLLDAAERHATKSPKLAQRLLGTVTHTAHAVRWRVVEAKVRFHAGARAEAWEAADALSREWLGPAKSGAVNQSIGRSELLQLLALFEPQISAKRCAEVKAAPAPAVVVPEGDVL